MNQEPAEIYLQRVDPSQNMARFYVLSIQPNLFGGCSVVREWGRIGTRGARKIDLIDDAGEAVHIRDRIARSKRRRGYTGSNPTPERAGADIGEVTS